METLNGGFGMNNIEKIEYICSLREEKNKLEIACTMKSKEIEEIENKCEHITVITRGKNEYLTSFRCLLCGKKLVEPTEYLVYAMSYLSERYDEQNPLQSEEKFNMIQTLAIGILKDNPNMPIDNLVEILNSFTNEPQNGIEKVNKSLERVRAFTENFRKYL